MMSGIGNLYCCLKDPKERCGRLAGNANYNKRIQRSVAQQSLSLSLDRESSHNYICEHHKTLIMKERIKRKRRDCGGSDEENSIEAGDAPDGSCSPQPDVELHSLQMNTLRRLKRHYKIPTRPGGVNKTQLVESLLTQFRTIPVEEKECLTYFIYMIKANKSKFDQPAAMSSSHTAGGSSAPGPASPEM